VRLQRRGADEGWLAEELPSRLEHEAREAVEAAVAFARESPFPSQELAEQLVHAS
jgi:pyruvate dehydrogenase E1 component alpha subunit